jgi:hypothetical protein
VIVEERTYHVFTGKLPEVVRMYAEEGRTSSRSTSATSSARSPSRSASRARSCTCGATSPSRSASRRRAALQADPRWQDFLKRLQPLIHTQRNRILVPTPFSPIR